MQALQGWWVCQRGKAYHVEAKVQEAVVVIHKGYEPPPRGRSWSVRLTLQGDDIIWPQSRNAGRAKAVFRHANCVVWVLLGTVGHEFSWQRSHGRPRWWGHRWVAAVAESEVQGPVPAASSLQRRTVSFDEVAAVGRSSEPVAEVRSLAVESVAEVPAIVAQSVVQGPELAASRMQTTTVSLDDVAAVGSSSEPVAEVRSHAAEFVAEVPILAYANSSVGLEHGGLWAHAIYVVCMRCMINPMLELFRCLMDLQCLWLAPVVTQSERFTSQSALIWLGGSALAARSIFTTLVELILSSD